MGFNDKNNNADGRDPDFGAIFMSNSGTKRECFKRRLFGLPSSDIRFVEQVKAGMILFLFEYEKKQLHGVFKAISDGAMNIVPNAFTSSGKQFPAQVKYIPIWFCKPLPEKLFRDAIRENYFSANKFNFGLSENQVCKLLYLFSMRKLELEVPGRPLTRPEHFKSERYPLGKVRRSVSRGKHVISVQNDQGVGDNISPIKMHKYQGDSLPYNGEVEYIGLNASHIVNKQGRTAELEMDRNGYVSDYLALKDERGFTAHENDDYIDIHASESPVDTARGYGSDVLSLKDKNRFTAPEKKDFMDIHLRPNIVDGYSESPSDEIRVHGNVKLANSDRLMSEDLRQTDWGVPFSGDISGLHNSNANPSVLYSKPILEHTSLAQNHLRPTSAMIYPILNQSHVTKGDVSPYEPDAPCLNFSHSSSVGINNGSKTIIEGTFPSTNCRRNSSSSPQCLMHMELKDMNRWHDDNGFLDSVLYGGDRDCMSFNEAHNPDQLTSKCVSYQACNSTPPLKSSSAWSPASDIGNSGRVNKPFSLLFHNYKSCPGGNVHPIALQENLSHETAPHKNNETFRNDFPWAIQSHSQVQYDDLCNHEYDNGCYGDSQINKSGHSKKKSSVFSRLSFVQDVNKLENGNHTWNEGDDFRASVDEVMEMARQSHIQWITERKAKTSKHKKVESLRDKTQIITSSIKGDCIENSLKDTSMDLTAASGDNLNKTAEKICFVDFKRRSKVRKLGDEIEIRSSNESEKSENLVLAPQKRRKLIRPNFNKSETSDDKGIDIGASQNLQEPLSYGSCVRKDVSESFCTFVQTENNNKTDAEVQDIVGQTHSEIKNSNHAREYVRSGEKGTNGAVAAVNDGSECMENVNSQNEDKSCHSKEGLCMMDKMKSGSVNTESLHSICQEHTGDKIICAGKGVNSEEEMPKDYGSSLTIEVKDGSKDSHNSGNEKAPTETCHIKEGLDVMDSIKSVSPAQNHCRGVITEEGMSKDGSYSFTTEVKDGSGSLQYPGYDSVPVATCEQKMAEYSSFFHMCHSLYELLKSPKTSPKTSEASSENFDIP